MTNERIKIKIMVAQRQIELTINKEWECYYREVEEIINKSFLDFAKKWTHSDHQDLLSKILIHYVALWKESEERLSELEEELIPKMQELKTLTDSF